MTFVKCMIKKYIEIYNDINLPLLQIGLMSRGQGLPSLATLLSDSQIGGFIPNINKVPLTTIKMITTKTHCKYVRTK